MGNRTAASSPNCVERLQAGAGEAVGVGHQLVERRGRPLARAARRSRSSPDQGRALRDGHLERGEPAAPPGQPGPSGLVVGDGERVGRVRRVDVLGPGRPRLEEMLVDVDGLQRHGPSPAAEYQRPLPVVSPRWTGSCASDGLWAPHRRALTLGLVLIGHLHRRPRRWRSSPSCRSWPVTSHGLALYGWVFSTFQLASLDRHRRRRARRRPPRAGAPLRGGTRAVLGGPRSWPASRRPCGCSSSGAACRGSARGRCRRWPMSPSAAASARSSGPG